MTNKLTWEEHFDQEVHNFMTPELNAIDEPYLKNFIQQELLTVLEGLKQSILQESQPCKSCEENHIHLMPLLDLIQAHKEEYL